MPLQASAHQRSLSRCHRNSRKQPSTYQIASGSVFVSRNLFRVSEQAPRIHTRYTLTIVEHGLWAKARGQISSSSCAVGQHITVLPPSYLFWILVNASRGFPSFHAHSQAGFSYDLQPLHPCSYMIAPVPQVARVRVTNSDSKRKRKS
jgi:hypothetical protein